MPLTVNTPDQQISHDGQVSMIGGMRDIDHPTRLNPDQFSNAKNIEIRDTSLFKSRRGSEERASGGTGTIQGGGFFEKSAGNAFCIKVQNGIPYQWGNSGASWTQIGSVTLDNTEQDVWITTGWVENVGKVALFFQGAGSATHYWNGDDTEDLVAFTDTPTDPISGNQALSNGSGRIVAIGKEDQPDHVFMSNIFSHGAGKWDRTNMNVRLLTDSGGDAKAVRNYRKNSVLAWTPDSVHLIDGLNLAQNEDLSPAFTRTTLDTTWGTEAFRSPLVAGENAFFLSQDNHIRTIQRTEFDIAFGVSMPVTFYQNKLMGRINKNNAKKCASVEFDNYALFAVPLDDNTKNSSVIVLDLMNYVQLPNGPVVPICLGEWTGWNVHSWIVARFNNEQRLFWIDNSTGNLYEGLVDKNQDYLGSYPTAEVELRGFDFRTTDLEKTARHGQVKYEETYGTLTISVKRDNLNYTTVKTKTIDGSVPALNQTLNFTLGTPVTDRLPFYFYGMGRSRFWQLKLSHASGPINVREVSMGAFIESEKTGAWG